LCQKAPDLRSAKKDSKNHSELIGGRLSVAPGEACDILVSDIGPRMTRAMSPQTAYMISTMLRDVGVYGTAPEISKLKRQDIAGKTGTTDKFTDAWFVGFNPKYTTGVWIGYDTRISLGDKEFGSTAATPVWINFMSDLLRNEPNGVYPVPSGLVLNVDRRKIKDPVKVFWSAQPDFPVGSQVKRESPMDATQPTIATVSLNTSGVEAPAPRPSQPVAAPKRPTVAAAPQRLRGIIVP
jgi:membrane carboxypeptidase/penicillin-binding protein